MKYLIIFFLLIFKSHGAENRLQTSYWTDLKDTFSLLGNGAVEQFKEKNNLYASAFFIPATWYAFEHDDRLLNSISGKDYGGWVRVVSDSSIVMSFPILPITTYLIGKSSGDNKLINFSIEFLSGYGLAMIESGLMSFIHVHDRPRKDDINFWEETFRGDSSFPSGHVIPYTMLALKVFQYYGPYAAILPATAALVTGFERVNNRKHWSSDLVAGVALAFFASEGVRRANNFKDNHPLYKRWLEGHLEGGLVYYKGTFGPRVSYGF